MYALNFVLGLLVVVTRIREDDGAGRGVDGDETDEADFGEVDARHHLLEYFGVGSAFGIDVVGEDVKRVVASCDVDDAETDSRETED